MKQRQTMINSVGIPSLFLIFAVLCMVILSLLTVGASQSDLNTSEQAMEQTTYYYEAGGKATDMCQSAELLLEDIRAQAKNKKAYWKMVSECFLDDTMLGDTEGGFSYDSSAHRLSLHTSISDVQNLCVEADILYPSDPEDACMDIVTWKAKASDSWNPDTSLFTKGEN